MTAREKAMSTAFKEFLHQQAEKHQAEADAGKATIDEWRKAIESLFIQIRGWIKESDPKGVIEIEESQEEIREPGLGRYRVPRLNLRVFGKWIGIIPKARKTVGTAKPPRKSVPERAEGRVDITDELRRHVLYRFREGDHDLWMIEGLDPGYDATEKSWPGEVRYVPMLETRALDQEAFERALMSYIR
jgi:hypothetical protein